MYRLKYFLTAAIIALFTSAASATVSLGVSVTGVQLEPIGSETQSTDTRKEKLAAAIGSIFIEKDFGLGSIGLDYVPYKIESETVTNSRSQEAVDTGTTNVDVDIVNSATLYGLVPVGAEGAYVKLGVSYADVETNETMATSTKYPDEELVGAHLSLGFNFDTDLAKLRIEAGYSQYEDLSVTGTGGDGTANTVHVKNLDGPHARISLVKSF